MAVLSKVEIRNRSIPLDDEGYLVNYEDWNEEVAQWLAENSGAGLLSGDKLEMLKFIRWYYRQFNYFPLLGAICKNVHKPKDCVKEEFMSPLLAWKLAGLPRPEEPIRSFLINGQTPG